MRILLTEDDPALADLLLRACRQEGYSVDWVSDGVAADLALDQRKATTPWYWTLASRAWMGWRCSSVCANAGATCP